MLLNIILPNITRYIAIMWPVTYLIYQQGDVINLDYWSANHLISNISKGMLETWIIGVQAILYLATFLN